MEDQKIVQLYWDRKEQAIRETEIKYGGYCTSIARNILENYLDAEECVNDTYWKAWDTMPPHRPEILSAFLGKITRNLSLNRYKYNTAEKRGRGQMPLVLEEVDDFISGKGDVEQEIENQELIKEINHFLGKLSLKKRSMFICRYWYFDSIADIGERFGMTENHVSVTLNRLREKLRCYLLERGFVL